MSEDSSSEEEDDGVPVFDGSILTQEQLEKIRRKQREEQGLDSSEENEMEMDNIYVTPESLQPHIKKKMDRAERLKVLKESKEDNEKFKRQRTGRTSKVLARNKPFMMKSFSQKQLKKEEDRITSGKTKKHRRQFGGKIRKRFGKSGLSQKKR